MNLISNEVLSVGIDLVEADRIQTLHEKHGQSFLNKVFTEEEQSYCFAKKNPYPHLAARFAAKEAVSKAFGCGIGADLNWKSVSVQIADNGKPSIKLDFKGIQSLSKIGASKVLISLTHTNSLAQAFAVCQ